LGILEQELLSKMFENKEALEELDKELIKYII
jgi:hypothetical protein